MAAVLWLCFKLPSCLFGNTNDTSVMHEKAKCVCFIYMQPQKVKFKFVQINMKHVLYVLTHLLNVVSLFCLSMFFRTPYSIALKLASVRVCFRSIQNNLMAFTIYCHYIENSMVSEKIKLLAHLTQRRTR